MAIKDQGTCKIEYLDQRALGVCSSPKLKLPYTLPGELVSFEKHQYRKESKDILKAIVVPSENRISPSCKYFGVCGGCSLQHANETEYKTFKTNLITKALSAKGISSKIMDIIILGAGQRRRANLEVIKKEEDIFLGFHRYQSHQIINIDACPAMMPELSALLTPLKELFSKILGNFQKAQIYLTQAANGTDLTIRPHKPLALNKQQQELLKDFVDNTSIIRLYLHNSRTAKYLYQKAVPYIILDNEVEVEIDAHGFLQSSFKSDTVLQELMLKYFQLSMSKKPIQKAVDLFCGRGTFTFALSRFCEVDGFESEATALAALEKAALQFNRQVKVIQRDLFNSPLSVDELNQYRFAVINPPRSGALSQCKNIASTKLDSLVYISCSPESFAEDAAILCSEGYSLQEVTPLDQFYWSHHLEVVGYFTRI